MSDDKVVQSMWIGKLSELERLSIRSFLKVGYEYHLYSYGELQGVPDGVKVIDANTILSESNIFVYRHGHEKGSYSGFANLFRYKMLLEVGGTWVDTDMVCLHALPEERYLFASQRECVNNNLIRCPSGDEFARRCYEEALKKNPSELKLGDTGPYMIGPIIEDLGFGRYVLPFSAVNYIDYNDVSWFFLDDPEFVGRLLYEKVKDSYCIHMWSQILRSLKIDKDAKYSDCCLYEILKRYVYG